MKSKINLKKPVIFFDIETTGLNVATDRICSIALSKLNTDGTIDKRYRLLNPTISIPQEATDVHGIKNEDVSKEPTFKQISKGLYYFMQGCDLGGYNAVNFDLPLLSEEFARCGMMFPDLSTKIVDAGRIFHLMNPRTLEAAYKEYCGKDLEDAHDAQVDTDATLEVFMKQVEVHEIGNSIDEISLFCKQDDNRADLANKIILVDGEYLFNFGKSKGLPVHEDIGFARWMLDKDFTYNTKMIIKYALERAGIDCPEIKTPE